jgi:transposase InsO family protein
LQLDPSLSALRLPKPRALAYFFRAVCPELLQPRNPRPPKPQKARHVHEIWQIDGKEAIRLADGTIATVLDVREPVACISLGAFAHSVKTKKAWRKLNLREIQADLRQLFTKWGLPKGIQTDRESVYGSLPTEAFPTLFTLWLVGLGIQHHLSRPAQPTDQAHVERNHQTIFYWMETPYPWPNLSSLQAKLDEACYMHNEVLPSRARDCNGGVPIEVHPEVCNPRRPYHPGIELTLFDLARVDDFLSRFSWSYKVSKMGQFRIAKQRYSLGQAVANQYIDARFEPDGRQFAFYDGRKGKLVKRCPAKGLDVAIITGLDIPPSPPPGPIQLSFAL